AVMELKDSSAILQQRQPSPLFFVDPSGMSVIQVIYMLLDSVGFTSLVFTPDDVRHAVPMNFFWTNPDASVWEMLEEVCRSTQITAYFDEYDNLRLRSLRSLYEDALSTPPKAILSTIDLPDSLSNIVDIDADDLQQTNKITVNYDELRSGEITESG